MPRPKRRQREESATVGQFKRCRLPTGMEPELRALLVRMARVGAWCHQCVRVYAAPERVGGGVLGGRRYRERSATGDRGILDEFATTALEELHAIRDANAVELERQLAPRIAEVRSWRDAAHEAGRSPPARSLK